MKNILEFLQYLYSAFDTNKIQWFPFVPQWVIMDIAVIVLGIYVVGFIIKYEEHPKSILLELFCFIFLFAAVYENLATVMGWYGFGKSIVMIFNVPLSVPLIEALFTYAGIRFTSHMKIPKWGIVVLVGFFGVLADLTLDPLALAQVNDGIGRWSWYIDINDVNIFGAPVYNYSGWFLICGYGSLFILLGRHWYKKSGYNNLVGIVYPPLCFLGALALMVSPLSAFLLWLGPFFTKGGWTEYIMFVLLFIAFLIVMFIWKGKMKNTWDKKVAVVFPVVFGVFYLINIIFDCIANRFDILLFSIPWILITLCTYCFAYKFGKKE